MADFEFTLADSNTYKNFISERNNETKIGQTLHFGAPNTQTKYLILGIKESIGAQANYGRAGAENAYNAFLKRFLNMQSNIYLSGEKICILGEINSNYTFDTIANARLKIEALDELLTSIISTHAHPNHTIIIVGGGHNNAYPIIHAVNKLNNTKINVVNIDPHADCRPLEGRHSGNPFSYAFNHDLIDAYAVFGLHKVYNSQFILDFLKEHKCTHSFFDDHLDNTNKIIDESLEYINELPTNTPLGIEIDLDAIQDMPSSALSPSGLSLNQIRYFIRSLGKNRNISYIHLPEGAPLNTNEETVVGKSLSYLVSDFVMSSY